MNAKSSKHINIDEILEPLVSALRSWVDGELDGTSFYGDAIRDLEKDTETAKQQLYDLMLEVIGGDSKFREPEDDLDRGVQIGYDACRAEQRQKLEELFSR